MRAAQMKDDLEDLNYFGADMGMDGMEGAIPNDDI